MTTTWIPTHTPVIHCKLVTRHKIAIGPAWKTVLQIEALRDLGNVGLRVDFSGVQVGMLAETILEEQLPLAGWLEVVHPVDGDNLLLGRVDVPAALLANSLARNACIAPYDFWAFPGPMRISRGCAVGIVVRSNVPAWCKVTVWAR